MRRSSRRSESGRRSLRRAKGFIGKLPTWSQFKANWPSYLLKLSLVGGVCAFFLVLVLFAWFSRDLPEPGEITRRSGSSTVFLDRNDEVLYEMFEDKNRIPVKIENVPEDLKQAVISIEDKNFYEHNGFSVWGYVRSVFRIATTGRIAGGSTLTQQLVKNVLLSQERTLVRKIKELVLSVEIERKFTKEEILEMYLNESPFGGTFWGVQSAAKGYFDKDVSELTLVESAIIAGLPQRPSVYNPLTGKEGAYKGRTKDVLRRMREDGYLTKDEEEQALKDLEKVKFEGSNLAIQAPHFVFYVRDLIAEEFGEKVLDEGIRIKTTLDVEAQKDAQQIVEDEIDDIRSLNATNGAVVILDSQTGEILSMVGSYDYNDEDFGRFNVTTAERQPGSSVKPFTYATALSQGYTAASVVMDTPVEFANQGGETYAPGNYDNTFRGPVQYRFALANSLNIPAVKVLAQVGITNMMQTAYDMGIKSFEPTDENVKRFGLSVTLGGGETTLLDLTTGFSTFARGGAYVEPIAILEIQDHNGKTIYKANKQKPVQVIDEEVAFIISHILSDNNARAAAFGTGSLLNIPGRTVAVKTGTTNDKRDNWTVGYTNDVTVGVWVGNNDNSAMNSKIASGLTGASPIWNSVMRALFALDYDDGIMDVPKGVEALQIDSLMGGLPRDGQPTRSEYFITGTEPTDISPYYQKVKISKNDTNKLANDIEIKNGQYEEKDFIVLTEDDPISTDGINRWQVGIQEWINGQDDSRYKAPTETSSTNNEDVTVSFREPNDKSRINSNKVKVRARITSIEPIRKVEIYVDGNKVKELSGDRDDLDETLDLSNGTYTIKILAENSKGKGATREVRIGVNMDWDADDSPAPTTAPTATTAPTPEPTSP